MTLDECRDALEMAKLSMKADAIAAQVRQLIDWAEAVQQFLEVVHGPKETVEEVCPNCEGHMHVCEEPGAAQVWIACPNCGGKGKVQKPAPSRYPVLSAAQVKEQRRDCPLCGGSGRTFEDDQSFECSCCNGSGVEPT